MNEFEARRILDQIEGHESKRRPRYRPPFGLSGNARVEFNRMMSVMADYYTVRFGLVAGLRGDRRFRPRVEAYRENIQRIRPRVPRGR